MSEQTQVRVDVAITINLGNYENVKVQLGMTESPRAGETAPECFDRVYNFLELKLNEKARAIQADNDQRR